MFVIQVLLQVVVLLSDKAQETLYWMTSHVLVLKPPCFRATMVVLTVTTVGIVKMLE